MPRATIGPAIAEAEEAIPTPRPISAVAKTAGAERFVQRKAKRALMRRAKKGAGNPRDLYVMGLLEKDNGNLKRAA